MNNFDTFVASQLSGLKNDAAYTDEEVYSNLVGAFKASNRQNFSTNEEADLAAADDLSPYSDVKTLSEMNALIRDDAPQGGLFMTPEPEQKAEVTAPQEEGTALGFSVDNAQKLFGSAVSTIGDLVGVDGISEFGQEYVKKQEREILENNYQSTYNKGGIETLTEDGAGAFVGWLGESILENFATTGAALGGAAATALTLPFSAPLAAVIGTTTTVGTVGLSIGEVRQELEDQGIYYKGDALMATGAGIVVGLLDRIGAGKVIPKESILKGMAESGVLKELGKSAATEFGTEAAQEAGIIGTAYFDGAEYTASETFNRVIDAGIIGGAMGAGAKGGTHALAGIVPKAESLVNTVKNVDIGDIDAGEVGGALGTSVNAQDLDGVEDSTVFNEEEIAADAAQFINPEALADTTPEHKSRSRIVYMPITDFLALADPLDSPKESYEEINAELEAGGKVNNIPFLKIEDADGKLSVFGHEGRNRALAIQAQGGTVIPVEITHATKRFEEGADALATSIVSQDGSQTFEFNLKPEDVTKKAEDIGFVIGNPVAPAAKVESLDLEVSEKSAGETFNDESTIKTYTDKESGGVIRVRVKPDGSASVIELLVPEEARGQGIGQLLQERAQTDHPNFGGQVSSKAAATTAYRLGRRPVGNPDATIEEVYAAIDKDSSVNLVITPELKAEAESNATEADTAAPSAPAADGDILGDIVSDFETPAVEGDIDTTQAIENAARDASEVNVANQAINKKVAEDDPVQSDATTIPNTAGVVVSDAGAVDATVRANLETIAIEKVKAFNSGVRAALKDLRDQWGTNDPAYARTKYFKDQSFESWSEVFEDATRYNDVKVEAIEVFRKEALELLSMSGITLEVSESADSQKSLQENIASGTVTVAPVDKVRSGILSARVEGENYTYAELLNGLKQIYGYGATGVDYDAIGNSHADEVMHSMFSEKARAIVAPFIANGFDVSYIVPKADLYTELDYLYKGRDEVKDGLAVEEEGDAQPDSAVAKARKAGVIEDQVPLGDKFRAVADRAAKAVGLITPENTPKSYKAFADFIQFSVLSSQEKSISGYLRDKEALKGSESLQEASSRRGYKRAAKKYIDAYDGDQDQLAVTLDLVYKDLLDGTLSVQLKDDTQGATVENIQTDAAGNAYLVANDGVSIRKIPVEMLAPLAEYVTARFKYQRIRMDEANARIAADIIEQEGIDARIATDLAKVKEAFVEQDMLAGNFKGLGATKSSKAWVAAMSSESVTSNPFTVLLEAGIEQIVDKAELTTVKAQEELATDLRVKFYGAAAIARDLDDFNDITGGAFLDAPEIGGDINTSVALSLGPIDKDGVMQTISKNIADSMKLSDRIDAQIAFNQEYTTNTHYVSKIYKAFTGTDPAWLQGMARPKTKEQVARRAAYESSIADELEESAGEDGPSRAEHEAEAKKMVTAQVQAISMANKHSQSGGKDQDLMFSALNASRQKGTHTTEYEEFLGVETDPAVIMEESIIRMREDSFARDINNYLYENFVYGGGRFQNIGDVIAYNQRPENINRQVDPASVTYPTGIFRNKSDVDEYNESVGEDQQVDISTLVEIDMRSKDNLAVPTKMLADPRIASSRSQFAAASTSDNFAFGLIQSYGAEYRVWHTVASLPLGVVNLWSGLSTMVMGGANPVRALKEGSVHESLAKELTDVLVRGLPIRTEEMAEALSVVAGSNVKAGQIQRDRVISGDLTDKLIAGIGGLVPAKGAGSVTSKFRKGWKDYTNVGEGLYRFGDLLPKLVVYTRVKADMMETYSEDMTDAEIQEIAARHARDMSFDLAQVPEVVRTMREKFLLGGGFISYDALLFATTTKNIRNINELRTLDKIKWGNANIDNFDPATDMARVDAEMPNKDKVLGYAGKRAAYMTASLSVPVAVNLMVATSVAALSGLFGDDEDELSSDMSGLGSERSTIDNMRQLLPDYYRNGHLTIVDHNDKGVIEWIDTGRLANHGKFLEGWNAVFNSDPDTSAFKSASDGMAVMFGTYFAPSFGLQAFSQIIANETQFGQRIYNPNESILGNSYDIAVHLAGDITGTSTLGRAVSATIGLAGLADSGPYNQYSGQEEGLGKFALDHAGLRVKRFDPVKEFQSRVGQESYQLRADKALARSHWKSFNELSQSRIDSQVRTLNDAHVHSMGVIMDKIDAARGLGLTEAEIKLSLKGKVTAKAAKALMIGIIPPLDISGMGKRNTQSNSIKRIEAEAKTNFTSNFERATEASNRLL